MNIAEKILRLKQDFDAVYKAGQESGGGGINPLEYAIDLSSMYKNATFPTDYELILNVSNNLTTIANAFYPSYNLKKVTIKGGNETTVVNFNATFRGCENLETVDMTEFKGKISNANGLFWWSSTVKHLLGEIDFSECTTLSNAFNTENLVTFTPKANTIKVSINMSYPKRLSKDVIQSIFDGLATVDTAQTLTLRDDVKLLQSQVDSANAKGWTVAGGTVVSEEEYYG